jgi:hypothetical protein
MNAVRFANACYPRQEIMQRGIALRLFFTCWILYSLHFATNIVREIYLAIALGDHLTFRVDEYAGLHPDLFEKRGHGWHINNNPGASMIACMPYALNRIWIDPLVERVRNNRNASGGANPPAYDSPWPLARQFYEEAWRRGLDVKLGLAALVIQVFFMAPLSAAGVVLMFFTLHKIFDSHRAALWLSILYGFGTPVFFRTAFLNQNLITAHFVFAGFILLWNVGEPLPSDKAGKRFLAAGVASGLCVLMDYSGWILFVILFLYGLFKHSNRPVNAAKFLIGALPPLALLWFYQWKSFGQPLYPPQFHMPHINPYVTEGVAGFGFPETRLLWALLFDYRFGLLLSCPLLFLAPFSFFTGKFRVPRLELVFFFLFFIGLWIFFGGVNYTNLQFNTGIRYLVAIVPFLFIPTAAVLLALPRPIMILLAALSVFQTWCMAMYRDVERGRGVFEPFIRILQDGLQLPALTTIRRMEGFQDVLPFGGSALPFFFVAAVVVWFLWRKPRLGS